MADQKTSFQPTETFADAFTRLILADIERKERARIEAAIENRLATIGAESAAGAA